MAKFTFSRDYFERQPGPKRHYKDWKAGQTVTMTKEHAEQLEADGYGSERSSDSRLAESD